MKKTVMITGANAGIGLASVAAFGREGWNVVAAVRDIAKAQAVGLDLAGSRVLVVPLDVTRDGDAEAAVDSAMARFGGIDVLVNNAGYGPMGPLETMSVDEIARVFQTNSLGPVRLIQAVLPVMRANRSGRIVNVSSMGGEFTTPFAGAYHASKYALESLSDALRFEVAPFGIDVIVVQPGPVQTALAANAVAKLRAAAEGPYAGPLGAFADMSDQQMARGQGVLTPPEVAEWILRAATDPRPRTRYKVGSIARVMPLLRRTLSDRLWDGMWRRMIPSKPANGQDGGLEAIPTGGN